MMILSYGIILSAQTLPDFSGVWIQDKSKSDDFYKRFNVQCALVQTAQSFNVITTFSDSTGKVMVTRENTFPLDGKEATDSKGAKKSAKWSADKKVLTTSDTKDYGGDLVGVTTAYSISANGLILTVKTEDIKPGVNSITQVFNKKK
jgi:hypothetical protein